MDWQPIETAPLKGCFLAINAKWDLRKCWRHKPSARTDMILTWARNGKFPATHWMPLPEPPTNTEGRG